MSDEENLFGDSSDGDDTDDLISASKNRAKPVIKTKSAGKRLQQSGTDYKRVAIPGKSCLCIRRF